MSRARLNSFYRTLLKHYGPQHWWPADSPFEVIVGAILTQNTAWTNVEKAVLNLKAAGLLDPQRILEVDEGTLALAVRPTGYFRQKTARLKGFVRWLLERCGGDLERLKATPLPRLREELLKLKGVGPETADSILLYALGIPSFVVDTYTYRVLSRHGLVPDEASYEEMKEFLEANLPVKERLYNEFHALFVAVGKECCRPAEPRCRECPLRRDLTRHVKSGVSRRRVSRKR
jgi:endonuclease-3 related protein